MKPKKSRKTNPEEAFRHAVEARLDVDFDYQQIQARLDVEEIARVGAARRVQTPDSVALRSPRPARRPAAVAVATTVVILGCMLGVGGGVIAHLAGKPTFPVVESTDSHGISGDFEEPDTIPQGSTVTDVPQVQITFYPDDTLTWEGVIYTRTNLAVPAHLLTSKLGEVKSDGGSDPHNRTDHGWISATSVLDTGTSFYGIQNYATETYIAAQTEAGYVLYMVEDAPADDPK